MILKSRLFSVTRGCLLNNVLVKYVHPHYVPDSQDTDNLGLDLTFSIAKRDDYEDILVLMEKAFFKYEPSFCALNMPISKFFLEDAGKSLSQGLTVVAKTELNTKLVGTSINSTQEIFDVERIEAFYKALTDDKLRKYYNFKVYNFKVGNLWNTYDVNKVFDIEYIFVSEEFRNRGIGFKLLEKSKQLGKDCGFKIIRCIATNFFVSQMCEKSKMKSIYKLPYNAYLDRTMKPVFLTSPPHTEYKVYIENQS